MNEDKELKKLQQAVQFSANDLDLQKWKKAVRTKKSFLARQAAKPWFQWVVAASVGFVIGAATFSHKSNIQSGQESAVSFSEDATFEQISYKD